MLHDPSLSLHVKQVTDGELEIHVPKTEEDSSKLQQITVE